MTTADVPAAIRARRHPQIGLWVGTALTLAFVGWVAFAIARNPNIDHATVARYAFAPAILAGLRTTVVLALLAAAIGVGLGTLLATMAISPGRVLRVASGAYVWLFRGTPLLVQILVWGNLALLFPTLGLGIPGTRLSVVSVSTNTVLTPFVASVVALGLNEAAYMAEIVRAGILAVDRGQFEAAYALGMGHGLALRRIVLPQALRVIVPPSVNQFINLLKATSLVSVIAGGDLLTAAENVSSANLRTLELLAVATFWYLVLTSLTTVGQLVLERRLAIAHGGSTTTGVAAARPDRSAAR